MRLLGRGGRPSGGRVLGGRNAHLPDLAPYGCVRTGRWSERVAALAGASSTGSSRARSSCEAGVSGDEVARRLRTGPCLTSFAGSTRSGHRAPSAEARYLAAVKAAGEGGSAERLAAAWAVGADRGRRPPLPDVTCPTERRIVGIRTRRSRRLHPRRDDDPGSGSRSRPSRRTLVDLPSLLSFDDLERRGPRSRRPPRHPPRAHRGGAGALPERRGARRCGRSRAATTRPCSASSRGTSVRC